MSQNLLDCTPLPRAVNAFALMATELRAATYSTAAELKNAEELVALLDWLATRIPSALSREPVFLAFIGRLGVDGDERRKVRGLLDAIDVAIAAAQGGTAEPAGFRMKP